MSVARKRNPNWARDELILACDLVMRNDWKVIPAENRQVIELSELLRSLPIHSNVSRGPDFRNPNGVERKTADIATLHPDYPKKRTNGGRLTEEVFMDFLEQPMRMTAAAELLRIGVSSGEFNDLPTGPYEDDGRHALEGRLLERRYFARERNPKLRERKVKSVLRERGYLECEVCGFDFEQTYGERGKDYAECHHATPLHVSGPTSTRLKDLVILCANCHRMIHRGKQWISPDELRGLIQSRKLDSTAGDAH